MNIVCSICLDSFSKSSQDYAYSSKCGHVFHHKCILNWHEKSQTCPDCRMAFTEDNIYRLNFHCDDVLETTTAEIEIKLQELQLELTKKNEELAEVQLVLAKRNSEMEELEETCRAVFEKIESQNMVIEYYKNLPDPETNSENECGSEENLEPSSAAIEEPRETVSSVSIS